MRAEKFPAQNGESGWRRRFDFFHIIDAEDMNPVAVGGHLTLVLIQWMMIIAAAHVLAGADFSLRSFYFSARSSAFKIILL